MVLESRWLRLVGPGVIAVGAVGAVASTTLGVGGRAWMPRPCDGGAANRIAAARQSSPTGPNAGPSFRLEPILDRDGALSGQRLSVVLGETLGAGTLELPPESFAAGPFGDIVLVGSDDGTTSHLEAIDIAKGCTSPLADERAVIRRATVDPSGADIYEERVERATRADLGVWRRPIDGSAPARRVVAPLGPDARFGRTFSTEFTWDTAGRQLAIQACGEVACRTRVVQPDDGPVGPLRVFRTLDAPDLGPLVGVDGDTIVTYAACRGFPCPIVATDLPTGRRRVLVRDGGPAVLVTTSDGARVVQEVFGGIGRRLRALALDGRASSDLGPLPDGLRLRTPTDGSGGMTTRPSGWVLLAPDDPGPTDASRRPQLRHIPDGSAVTLNEAAR